MIGLILKTLTEMVDSSIMQQYRKNEGSIWLLFSRTVFFSWIQKTLKTCLIEEIVLIFFVPVFSKWLFLENKKKKCCFCYFFNCLENKKKTLFFMFFFSLFSHFISSIIVRTFPTTRNEGNSTNTSVFSFYFCTYWGYFGNICWEKC